MVRHSTQIAARKHRARKLYKQAERLIKKEIPERMNEVAALLEQASRLGSGIASLKLAEIYMNEAYLDLYNPDAAMQLLKPLAKRGNASAFYMLGEQLYLCGSEEEAVRALTRASQMGNIPAKALLGEMLLKGDGVGMDIREGVKLLSRAAQVGNIAAQLALSKAYHRGDSLPNKPERAIFWAKQAALQGSAYAQMRVAIYYAMGYGVERDLRESYFWIHQAAKNGLACAQASAGECLQEGLGARRNKKRGAMFYSKATEQGDLFAKTRLGLCYILGRGLKQDKEKGVSLLKEAAAEGYVYAPIYLVLFGKIKYIPIGTAEIERYEKRLEAEGYAVSFSEEPILILKRRKNWIQAEYDHIEYMNFLDEIYDAEDDKSIPGPFDPLLNLGKQILTPIFRRNTDK